MDKKEFVNERMVTDLPGCMSAIIKELEAAGKYAAVHTYTCTLHSFTEFSGDTSGLLPVCELFTPGRLKAYQEWLLSKSLSWYFHLHAYFAGGIQPHLPCGQFRLYSRAFQ